MKEPGLRPKKRCFARNFNIFIIGFLILWMSIFLFVTPTEELSAMEIMQSLFPLVLMIPIGTGLFLFFRRQIVDIVRDETGDRLIFITYSGKRTELSPKEIKSVIKTDNGYVFHLTSGKQLSAYRYIPPLSFRHAKKMDALIEELSESGALPLKRWH